MAELNHKYMVVYSAQLPPNIALTGRCFVNVSGAEGLTTEQGVVRAELATLQLLRQNHPEATQLFFTWFTLLREDGSHVSN